MKRSFLTICAILICLMSSADDIKRISFTYDYVSDNPNETPIQAEQNAIVRAKLKALEEHFSVDVAGVSSVYQHSRQGGEEAKSTTDVLSNYHTSIRGEWVEIIEEKILDKKFENGFWHVRVHIVGRARNSSADKAEIRYAFVNNIRDRQHRDQYYHDDNLFMHFSSPVSGTLCVYLVDADQIVNCLLPYGTSTIGYQPIDANREYLFFTDGNGLILNAQKSSEQNVLYIIFSPNKFTKAADHESGLNWRGEQMLRQLSYKDFMNWIAKIQTRDKNVVVRQDIITIVR